MPREKVCSFCGKPVEPGTGMMFVTTKGEILWFCSSKCRKSFMMGRRASKLAWVVKARKV
ncbi:MAG: 50S ribosomal protein L24e [Acidilobaceae archaeon]